MFEALRRLGTKVTGVESRESAAADIAWNKHRGQLAVRALECMDMGEVEDLSGISGREEMFKATFIRQMELDKKYPSGGLIYEDEARGICIDPDPVDRTTPVDVSFTPKS